MLLLALLLIMRVLLLLMLLMLRLHLRWRWWLLVVMDLWLSLLLSLFPCWKSSKSCKVGMNHSIDMRISRISCGRALVPAVSLAFSDRSQGGSRHGMLVKGPARRGWWWLLLLWHLVTWPRLLFESNSRLVHTRMVHLVLNSFVNFRRPHSRTIARRGLVSYIKTAKATLKANVIHVEVSPLVGLDSLHHRRPMGKLGVDSHR